MLRNVISVIDGAAGSCGKAKVIGEIATLEGINLGASVTNCMPNAGHSFVDSKGRKYVFRNIPVSSVNPKTELFIGPGSAIDMEVFKDEYMRVQKIVGNRKIYIHEMTPLIEERHKAYERDHIKSGSTFKGCGAVTQEKVIRDEKLRFFKDFKNAIVLSNDDWLDCLYKHLDNENEYVMMEGSQGCDLDLNHSGNYPYVTSRNVSTTQLLADSGISAERLLQTILVIRPFPIRISNITKTGKYIYTGSYGTGEELKWTQVNLASMYGGYPFKGDVDLYSSKLACDIVSRLIDECPEVYLKQVFKNNYKNIVVENITLLEALEIERLVHKSRGEREYQTELIDLPTLDSELPENTIIDQSEETTVTKMERRIFDLDINKLKNNCRINTPSSLYLNFFEHLGYEFINEKGLFDDIYFNRYLREYLNWLEYETGIDISALGTGQINGSRIVKQRILRDIIK